MSKKSKKFRYFKNPRYLKGSVAEHTRIKDLMEYNQHRYKLFTAETKVDHLPPPLNPYKYLNLRQLSEDAQRLLQIDKENKNLLKKINIINRTTGRVDSFNPVAYAYKSKWEIHEKKMRAIDHHNREIYAVLSLAKSDYDRKRMQTFWKNVIESLRSSCKYPLVVLKKTNSDKILASQPSISKGLEKTAERPLCFMEFQVRDGPFLGRIVIELYNDHVPVTVQNFLEICSNSKKKLTYKNCVIHRIVPGKFFETGDITKGTGRGGTSIYGKKFAEEKHVLKHTKAGVLSMVRVGNQENNSIFCITFTKMDSLDRKNVVFGKIIRGAGNILKINGYGRKIGKPLADIYISNCGKINMSKLNVKST